MSRQTNVFSLPFVKGHADVLSPKNRSLTSPDMKSIHVLRNKLHKRLLSANSDTEMNLVAKKPRNDSERRSVAGLVSPLKLDFDTESRPPSESTIPLDTDAMLNMSVGENSGNAPTYLGQEERQFSQQAQIYGAMLADELVTVVKGECVSIFEKLEFDQIVTECDLKLRSKCSVARDTRYQLVYKVMRHYETICYRPIMLKDFKLQLPRHEFCIAFAILANLHKDAYKLFTPAELIIEIVTNWPAAAHLIYSLYELVAREADTYIFPTVTKKNPLKLMDGQDFYCDKIAAIEFRELMERHKHRIGSLPTSLGEQFVAVAAQLEIEEDEDINFYPRKYLIGRIFPGKVADIFDADVTLALEVKNLVEGNDSCLNRCLLEKAYPGVWDRITDKFLASSIEDNVFSNASKIVPNNDLGVYYSPKFDYVGVKNDIAALIMESDPENPVDSSTKTPDKNPINNASETLTNPPPRSISDTPE